jgi:flagellin
MGLRINTNVQALNAQRLLGLVGDRQKNTMDKLASGQRINKAADDAAGLAISETLKAEIRSMKQATRNAGDGVALIQVAEGAMNEVGNILVRLRELSIQSASDTLGDTERVMLNKEVVQLKDEVRRIASSTEYAGTKLLDGSSPRLEIQVGIRNNPLNDRFIFDAQALVTTVGSLGLDSVVADTKLSAQQNLVTLDEAITKVSGNRATLGALQNRLTSTINNLNIYRENLESANSRIRDTDMAEETSELVKNNILNQSTIAMLSQANQVPQLALKLLS